MTIPDYHIRALCDEDKYPRTWSPSGGPDVGKEFLIPDAGPVIYPFNDEFLGAASYDIQIAMMFASPSVLSAYVTRGMDRLRQIPPNTEIDGAVHAIHKGEGIEVILRPGQPVLCHSTEHVRIPPHLKGELSMRSSFARDWLDHSSATSIWPGFQGDITFELRNDGTKDYSLRSGARPLQLSLSRMEGTPERPYSGIYQGQAAQLRSLKDADQ